MKLRHPQFFTLNFSRFPSVSRTLLLLAMAWAVAGCATATPKSGSDSIPFVYLNSYFEGEGNKSILDDMAAMGVSRENYWEMAEYSQTRAQFDAMMADPFVRQRVPSVKYGATDPAKQIAAVYEAAFKSHGWREVRGHLLIEETLGGGDWLRVYRKGGQQVLVHIIGPWEKTEHDKPPVEFGIRTIILKFLGLKPEDLLGKDYKLKKHPWFTPPAK
ncbi:MAG: hypothetical protein HZC54_04340 [Verrucomicrobia bacterium]|nr:hypothetical protein [Verrucomicrobiota bacterium]